MIVLSTDFGIEGPYIGQLKAVLYQQAPSCKVIDLFSDLPPYQARASAALISAYSANFPIETVFLCVVDPGVGMSDRQGVVVKSNDHWFVGPDNGLFDLVKSDDPLSQQWAIIWQPESLSSTFHGRDLFAPIAAELASGIFPDDKLRLSDKSHHRAMFEDDYNCVVYIDRFGNIITGIRADSLLPDAILVIAGRQVDFALTFGEVEARTVFWYKNSNGLVEIAANRAVAAEILKVSIGDKISSQIKR